MIKATWVQACIILIFIFLGSVSCHQRISKDIDTVACPLDSAVKRIYISHPYFNAKVHQKTKAFYEANGLKKNWLRSKRPSKRYKAFIKEVVESKRYGMEPETYKIDQLEKEIKDLYQNRKRTDAEASLLDIKITASFFLFTTHLLEGRIRYPGAKEFLWKRGQPLEDDVSMLLALETPGDIRKKFDGLQPTDLQYKKLQQALAHYRELEKEDLRFKPIDKTVRRMPGESGEEIPHVRRKLKFTDLEGAKISKEDSLHYDANLVEAVKKFQKRHGLKDDGIISGQTITFINMPFKEKSRLIELNLERLRWSPRTSFRKDVILINVPEYMLRVYRNENKKIEMRVVLGSEYNATPIFHDTLKYVVFSPTWNVPNSIFVEEFLPNLKENATYYSNGMFRFLKKGEEIDPADEDWNDDSFNASEYQVVQRPGASNALGDVKFIMPNNFSIYLHDTPADNHFSRRERALSHGCIRLEDPLVLAKYLLRDQREWNETRIKDAMKRTEPVQVNLKKDYPVHIVYRTVWIDEDDLVNFREDIYNHDQRHLNQLEKLQLALVK